ncbi:hypothetical protein C4D60_Mb03t11490 [Musa balbisiana]|uniref:Uncharacterized protein n=1 Tax=Musa balbisiana TaxID=52838 RepID=A0A4S8JAX8_MUSBA|nr:hypothetical protein C4D60_Mb03t11490 [Musa balbisiana]
MSIKQVIIQSEVTKEGLRSHGAYLSFPVHLDGTLLDVVQVMQLNLELFSWSLEVPAGKNKYRENDKRFQSMIS